MGTFYKSIITDVRQVHDLGSAFIILISQGAHVLGGAFITLILQGSERHTI